LKKALELNPDMTFINDLISLYAQTARYWNNDNGTDLEAIGGGFNITLKALKDKVKRREIANRLRDFADCIGRVSDVIEQYKAGETNPI